MLKNNWLKAILTLIVVFACFPRFTQVLLMGHYHIREYQSGRDQQWVRQIELTADAEMMKVKCALPANALVEVDPRLDNPAWTIKAAYFTFPLQVLSPGNPAWTHMVYFNKMKPLEKDVSVLPISEDVTVAARPGYGFTSGNCGDTSSSTRHVAFFQFAFILLADIACGMLIMAVLDVRMGKLGIVWFIASCYLLGNLALNIPLWPLYVAGMRYTSFNVLFVWSAVFTLLLFLQRNLLRRVVLDLFADCKASLSLPSGVFNKLLLIAGFAIFAGVAGSVLLDAVRQPVGGWDPFNNWVGPAKEITTHPYLQNRGLKNFYYPLLWNLTLAPPFAFMGNIDLDDHALWILAAMVFALIGQCIGILRLLRVENGWEYIAVSIYLCLFFNNEVFSQPYADVPLTAYLLGGVAAGLAWLSSPKKWNFFAIGILFGIGMVSIKLEGTVGLVFIGLALALCMREPLISPRRAIIPLLFILPVFVEVIWVSYLKRHGLLEEMGQTKHLFEGGLYGLYQKSIAIFQVVKTLATHKTLLLFFPTAGLALWTFITNRQAIGRPFMYLFLLSVFMHSFPLLALYGWPLSYIPNWEQAVYRLLMHAEPLAAITLGALLWAKADQPDAIS